MYCADVTPRVTKYRAELWWWGLWCPVTMYIMWVICKVKSLLHKSFSALWTGPHVARYEGADFVIFITLIYWYLLCIFLYKINCNLKHHFYIICVSCSLNQNLYDFKVTTLLLLDPWELSTEELGQAQKMCSNIMKHCMQYRKLKYLDSKEQMRETFGPSIIQKLGLCMWDATLYWNQPYFWIKNIMLLGITETYALDQK